MATSPAISESRPAADQSTEVHLPEAVLGVQVALRAEEVIRGVGVDGGDAVAVAQHLNLAGQPRQRHLAVVLRVAAAYLPEPEPDTDDDDHHEKPGDHGQDDSETTHGGSLAIHDWTPGGAREHH